MEGPQPDIRTLKQLRDKNHDRFRKAIKESRYDLMGMWYSEIFIFCLLCDYFECTDIIESGRARGVSTEILSNYYEGADVTIISIDNRPGSKDAEIAEKELSDVKNISLKYGDSTEIIPDIINEQTAVLIDGPKGDTALQMGMSLLEDTDVPFIAIHDLNKDVFHRDLSTLLFNHFIYTCEEELVDAFREYDEPIHRWSEQYHVEDSMYGPYLKDGEKSHSYGPTLGLFFNNHSPVNTRIKNNYLDYINTSITDLGAEFLKIQRNNGGRIRRGVASFGLQLGKKVIR